MVGWHHQLNGHEFEQAPGVSGQSGKPDCCSPWGRKESNTTERLNNNNPEAWTGFRDTRRRGPLPLSGLTQEGRMYQNLESSVREDYLKVLVAEGHN